MSTFKTVLSIVFPIVVIGAVIWRSDINGWSSIPWVILSFGVSVIRRPFEQENKGNVIVDTRSVSVERFLLVLVAVGAFFLPLLHLLTGIFSRFDYTLGTIPTIAGIVLFLSGLWFFWRSHVDLGRNWSVTVELRENHSLITQGVYKYIRHPMYSAIWLFQLAQPLLLHNWIAGFTGPIAFGLMYVVRVPYEERMMRDKFGPDYDDYVARTGRIWPRFAF